MKKATIILTALFLVGFLASGASAITISYGGTSVPGDRPTSSNPNAIVEDFNDGSFDDIPLDSITGNYAILDGSGTSQSAPPGGTVNSLYLTTPAPGGSSTGFVDVELTTAANYFGMYWGSMDSYNTLTFWNQGIKVGSFTGNQVTSPANGNQTSPITNQYVNFSDFTFDQFRLESDGFAFEVDNIAVAPVPEPGTFVLMGLGLAGLVGMRKKFRK